MQNHECSESSGEVLGVWPDAQRKNGLKSPGCQGTASGGDDTALRLKEEKQCVCVDKGRSSGSQWCVLV